jgi:cell division protein FtsB
MNQKLVVKSRTFLAKIARFGLILIFIGALLSVSRGLVRLATSGNRVKDARELLNKEKLRQEELGAQLEEVTSDFYREKQVRDQLGMAKPGETVIILPDEELLRRLSPRVRQEETKILEPNWRKWAKLFFEI